MSIEILVFNSRDDAVYTERAFWELVCVPRMRQDGYDVVVENNGRFGVVGKNAATGVSQPEAAHTLRWSDVEAMDGDRFWIASPAINAEFTDFEEQLRQAGVSITFIRARR